MAEKKRNSKLINLGAIGIAAALGIESSLVLDHSMEYGPNINPENSHPETEYFPTRPITEIVRTVSSGSGVYVIPQIPE